MEIIQPRKDEEDGRIYRCNHACPLYDEGKGCEATGRQHEESEVCEPWMMSVIPEEFDSALIITFAGVGSAEFHMRPVGGVTSSQMGALGASLTSRADFVIKAEMQAAIMEQRGRPRILTPGMDPRVVQEALRDIH